MNTILSSSSAYTKAFTASSCSVSRSNFAVKASKTRKKVAARVVAQVGRSCCLC